MSKAAILLWLLTCLSSLAHQNSTAFLEISQTNSGLSGRWQIPVRDLEFSIGIDSNRDGDVTWGEIRAAIPEITALASSGLTLHAVDRRMNIQFEKVLIDRKAGIACVVLNWQARVPSHEQIGLRYDFHFLHDPAHQCVVTWNNQSAILSDQRRTLDLVQMTRQQTFVLFLREGVTHIFAGLDHICFLIALMLPAVWERTQTGWKSVGNLRHALFSVCKIVTAFTFAHSVTLILAALRIVILPAWLVESVIALSVIVAALNNIWPLWKDRSWLVALGFGLVHGFGFAGAAGELPSGTLALAGFNLGVELGQLSIVIIFLPIAYTIRETWFYRWCAVRAGSLGIAAVACLWFVERVFEVAIF